MALSARFIWNVPGNQHLGAGEAEGLVTLWTSTSTSQLRSEDSWTGRKGPLCGRV